jgi:hypothetical protein
MEPIQSEKVIGCVLERYGYGRGDAKRNASFAHMPFSKIFAGRRLQHIQQVDVTTELVRWKINQDSWWKPVTITRFTSASTTTGTDPNPKRSRSCCGPIQEATCGRLGT